MENEIKELKKQIEELKTTIELLNCKIAAGNSISKAAFLESGKNEEEDYVKTYMTNLDESFTAKLNYENILKYAKEKLEK